MRAALSRGGAIPVGELSPRARRLLDRRGAAPGAEARAAGRQALPPVRNPEMHEDPVLVRRHGEERLGQGRAGVPPLTWADRRARPGRLERNAGIGIDPHTLGTARLEPETA